jgi:hypothetical protein
MHTTTAVDHTTESLLSPSDKTFLWRGSGSLGPSLQKDGFSTFSVYKKSGKYPVKIKSISSAGSGSVIPWPMARQSIGHAFGLGTSSTALFANTTCKEDFCSIQLAWATTAGKTTQ